MACKCDVGVKQIYFSSKNREDYNNTNPNKCAIKIKSPFYSKKAKLSFAQIPSTYYNITNRKNQFQFNSVNYTVSPGNYNLNELISELTTLIGGTITFNVQSFLLSVAQPLNFDLNFNIPNTIGYILGFGNSNNTGSNSYTGNYLPKLYNNSIFCITSIGSAPIQTSSNLSNVSFVIPHNVNKGEIIQFYNHTQFDIFPNVESLISNYVEFYFYDEEGELIQNLGDWVLMIQFFT